MNPFTEVKLYREAADVTRYHTKRTLRQQSLGHHSFNMLTMLLVVAPACRKEVIEAVMYHDLPELHTGDVPAPIKRMHPTLGPLLTSIESELYPLFRDIDLTADEVAMVKWLDTMELVLWCLEEKAMGNQYVVHTIVTGMTWVLESGWHQSNPVAKTIVSGALEDMVMQGIPLVAH